MTKEFESFISYTKISNQKITIKDQQITISTIPINTNLLIDCFYILLGVFLLSKFNEIDFYIVIIFIFGSINLWRDFETVNYIVIDIKEKVIVIHSKNIIKALLFKKKKILFSDILSISNIEVVWN